jgi:hypothetical protein
MPYGTGDDRWTELLEADEFWPRIIADEQFWTTFEKMEPDERAAAFMTRIRTDPAFVAETSRQVRERHAQNGGLILALIEKVGVSEARRPLQCPQH